MESSCILSTTLGHSVPRDVGIIGPLRWVWSLLSTWHTQIPRVLVGAVMVGAIVWQHEVE